jgi:uncharacterized protein
MSPSPILNSSVVATADTPKAARWFQDPFRWLLIAPPLTAVIAGGVTLWLAIASYDGLVVDDYYKQGLEINQVLARDELATALGVTAQSTWLPHTDGTGVLAVDWQGAPHMLAPAALDIKLIYATRAGLDRDVRALPVAAGRFEVSLSALPVGKWHVHIASDDWRLTDSIFVDAKTVTSAPH